MFERRDQERGRQGWRDPRAVCVSENMEGDRNEQSSCVKEDHINKKDF